MLGIIIPKEDAGRFRRLTVEGWWDGIDAIELADGSFFIAESDYQRLPVNLTVQDGEIMLNTKQELSKYPVKELKAEDYKTYEELSKQQEKAKM